MAGFPSTIPLVSLSGAGRSGVPSHIDDALSALGGSGGWRTGYIKQPTATCCWRFEFPTLFIEERWVARPATCALPSPSNPLRPRLVQSFASNLPAVSGAVKPEHQPGRAGYPAAMDSSAPDYSIVIPAFNEAELLPKTLAALRAGMAEVAAARSLRGEIVVCDNNSTDSTAAIARGAGATVVFEPHNQISRARNTGSRAARGRWLFMVDADTIVPAALLRTALEHLESGGVCGGGALLLMDTPSSFWTARLESLWKNLSLRFRLAAGSFVYVSRAAFDAVGGFPEDVYAGEEIWLSRRVKRWGRPRGLAFEIIREPPVVTSGRKTEWYSTATLLLVFLLFTVFPFAARSRTLCFLWYRRPRPAAGG